MEPTRMKKPEPGAPDDRDGEADATRGHQEKLVFVVFSGNAGSVVEECLQSLGWTNANQCCGSGGEAFDAGNWDLCWKPCLAYRSQRLKNVHSLYDVRHSSDRVRVINHFSSNAVLCTKVGLFRSLSAYYARQGVKLCEVMPRTYVVASIGTLEWTNFLNTFDSGITQWICKPSGLNCGRGIQVLDDVRKIRRFVLGSHQGPVVIQEYIRNPLLWHGRKFDIRVWALVLNDGSVWICRQGYLRTCSEAFSLDTIHDSTAHLTNYCLQRKSPKLGKHEPGNTLSFAQLDEYLSKHLGHENITMETHFMPRIGAIIVDTIRATWKQLNPGNSKNYVPFELFGYDFMLDTNLKPWLIEVNTNPFLGTQNQWHGQLVHDMLTNLFEIVAETYFHDNPSGRNNNQQEHGQGKLFELLYHPTKKPPLRTPRGRGRSFQKWLTVAMP